MDSQSDRVGAKFNRHYRRARSGTGAHMKITKTTVTEFLLEWIYPLSKRKEEMRSSVLEGLIYYYEHIDLRVSERLLPVEELIHGMQWAMSTGADVRELPMIRYIPVRIFLDGVSKKEYYLTEIIGTIQYSLAKQEVFRAYELPTEAEPTIKHLWFKTIEKRKQKDVEQIIERAFELHNPDRSLDRANKLLPDSSSVFLSALNDIPDAVIQVGNLLLAKKTRLSEKCIVVARTLTLVELKRLENDSSILRTPDQALDLLEGPPAI